MRLKIFIIIVIFSLPFQTFALKWHDDLITMMMMLQHAIRDKQIVVERDEKTSKIKRGSYRFSFMRDDVAESISRILYSHEKEAHIFSSENGEILLQVLEKPNTYYTYQFGKDPQYRGRYLLLISVRTGKPQNTNNLSYIDLEDFGVVLWVND